MHRERLERGLGSTRRLRLGVKWRGRRAGGVGGGLQGPAAGPGGMHARSILTVAHYAGPARGVCACT